MSDPYAGTFDETIGETESERREREKETNGHRGSAKTAPGSADRRPTIPLHIGETERAVNELEDLLIASDRALYQRAALIVSTGYTRMRTWDGKTIIGQVIEERGDYALLEDAESVARFVRYGAGDPRPCPPPRTLISTLKDRKSRLRFPVLVSVVNCPSISVDGRLLDEPGFDPETGVLYDPCGVSFPRVPDWISRAKAETALARILRLIETFKFVSDDDRAVALSLIFTAVAHAACRSRRFTGSTRRSPEAANPCWSISPASSPLATRLA